MCRDNETKTDILQRISRLLSIMIILCIFSGVCFFVLLIQKEEEYKKADNTYQKMQKVFYKSIKKRDQTTSFEVDFDKLKKINNEIVGWIQSAEKEIDYPIVQGQDNAYYLTHLFNRTQNKQGTIFMDYENRKNFSDKNTVLYGHNMKNESMFASITKYKKQAYYDSFPSMTLYTLDKTYTVEIFAGILTDATYKWIRFKYQNEEDFKEYIHTLKEKSTFQSTIELKEEDRILTLSTCSYEFWNARYVLFGKLVPDKTCKE